VLTALTCGVPDRVPRVEFGVDLALIEKLMPPGAFPPRPDGGSAACLEHNLFSVEESKAIARRLHLDNISYTLRAPVYAHRREGADGRPFYASGMIGGEEDLGLLRLPDPHDDALYADAAEFARQKDDYAACFVTRVGIFPTMLSLGMRNFSYALYDNLQFVETVLDTYCDWTAVVAERVCQLGFDVYLSTDDMAHKHGPFFSPQVFRDLVLPRYKRVAEKIALPWVIHTDGNVRAFVDEFLEVGVMGLHPIENGAMDIRQMKRDYAGRLCLLGNVDLNLLALGTPEEVDREVHDLIRDVGPGGGYIVASGNSLASYLDPANVLAMSEAVLKYGAYPLALGS
jgi:uroporphyrinogen decarboxylase